ncbi:MAG TPA: hypothetical protein DCF68_16485 [Cyanothece sp. UBA12306]|nr:hypothetical protein [Cyanothece sp. UBA12306]
MMSHQNSPIQLLLALVFSCLSLSPVSSQVPLDSPSFISPETEVDYTPLRNLLSKQQWREANETTLRLMLKAINRDQQGWVSREDIAKLACWDLKTLDNLWKEYSQGKFGFSVQFAIFVEAGNKPGKLVNPEFYDDFGNQIGWREDNQWIIFKENLNYSLDAPVGHLPNPREQYQITGGRLNYTTLTQRMVECNLVSYQLDQQPIYQPLEDTNRVEEKPRKPDTMK